MYEVVRERCFYGKKIVLWKHLNYEAFVHDVASVYRGDYYLSESVGWKWEDGAGTQSRPPVRPLGLSLHTLIKSGLRESRRPTWRHKSSQSLLRLFIAGFFVQNLYNILCSTVKKGSATAFKDGWILVPILKITWNLLLWLL